MDELYKQFGAKFREARKYANLSQEAVGRLVGLSRTSITNIESGNQVVQLHLLFELARAVGVNPQSLLPDSESTANTKPISKQLLKGLKPQEQDWAQRVVQRGKSQ